MNQKFTSVPNDPDTRILFQREDTLGSYDILHQKWVWDAIKAESIIFLNEDVADLEDQEIEKMVKGSQFYKGGSVTLKRVESGFTFVNINFKCE
jgi:endonuclease III-like uncharacterized protein